MITPEFTQNALVLRVEGADKIWALKSELIIPYQHIVSARLDAEVVKQWFHGLKLPGSSIPGVLTAGTFYQAGKRIFWDIHRPEFAVVITLRDETYNELVIEVEQPELLVSQLNGAIPSEGL